MPERILERVRDCHWRGNQRFSPSALFDLCVLCYHFEFNISLKFCFRLYYTVLCGKMQEGNGEKSKKVRFWGIALLSMPTETYISLKPFA